MCEIGRPGPAGAPSISVVPGLECLYFSGLLSLAAAPPAKPGECALSPSISGEFLYRPAFWLRRLRRIQKMIAPRARASGMPTAQPTITPIFDFEPEPPSVDAAAEFELVLAVGFTEGVIMSVLMTVETPPGPEETLVDSEVTGFAADVGAEDPGASVFDAELPPPLPEPEARPVLVASVG